MAKIFIETNFDFKNLVRKYKRLTKDATSTAYKEVAKTARRMLKNGEVTPSLTSKSRTPSEFSQYGSKPLYKTKDLYKSIKGTTKGLYMREYGRMHNNGEVRTEKREFIKVESEAVQEIASKLMEGIHKALKK
mgnify:CR=1 FL=1|tara:strand:+ start:291 stop:689 length:399 start_codon:yes stop_codon:yes gene_type:complete